MYGLSARGVAAAALLGASLFLTACTAPTLSPLPSASVTTPGASAPGMSPSAPAPGPDTPGMSAGPSPGTSGSPDATAGTPTPSGAASAPGPANPSSPAPPTPSAGPGGGGGATDLRGTTVGLLTGYDSAAGTLTIDVVYFLTGEDAVAYLAERPPLWESLECPTGPYGGGSTAGCSLPNDYYLVNENPRLRTLPLAAHAGVKLIPWPNCCETAPSTREVISSRTASGATYPLRLVSFDVSPAGEITELREVYTP